MSRAAGVALLVMLTLAAACGTVAPPPRDQFHRLVPEAPAVQPAPADAPLVTVAPFGASGLLGQRALVYAAADGTTLEPYGYHFWIDSPRKLLQESLADHLRRTLQARILTAASAREGLVIRGQVYRFERFGTAGAADQAIVSLGFEVFRADASNPVLTRRFERRVTLEGDDIAGYVAATSAATREIFAGFAGELEPLVAR